MLSGVRCHLVLSVAAHPKIAAVGVASASTSHVTLCDLVSEVSFKAVHLCSGWVGGSVTGGGRDWEKCINN